MGQGGSAKLLAGTEDASSEWSIKHMSSVSLRREFNPLTRLHRGGEFSDAVLFAGGVPHPTTYPVAGVTLELADGAKVTVDPALLAPAQTYAGASGFVPLLKWMANFVNATQAPGADPAKDVESGECRPMAHPDLAMSMSAGASDALDKLFHVLLDEGDVVFMDEISYVTTIVTLAPLKARIVHVPSDSQGMVPEGLRAAYKELEATGYLKEHKAIVYTMSTGNNPLGTCADDARKRDLYKAFCELDLVVVDDEAYWPLRFDSIQAAVESAAAESPSRVLSHEEQLEAARGINLGLSLTQLDVEARIVRVDSGSKWFGPGYRFGWVVGHRHFIQQYEKHTSIGSMGGSPFAQALVLSVFTHWGVSGLHARFKTLQVSYWQRWQALKAAMDTHLSGLATWVSPAAGMFVMINLTGKGGAAKDEDLLAAMQREKVLGIPGHFFHSTGNAPPSIRLCFSWVGIEEMDEGMRRLAAAISSL